VIAKYRGFTTIMPAGLQTVFNFALTDTMLLRGARILAQNVVWGDLCHIELVDVDGVSFPPGTVLARLIDSLFLNPEQTFQIDLMVQDANLFPSPGLYLRATYVSIGQVDVNLSMNLYSYVPIPTPQG